MGELCSILVSFLHKLEMTKLKIKMKIENGNEKFACPQHDEKESL